MENKISGVYKITNNITGDFYIGSSKNIKKRWYNHKCHSKWSLNPNVKLYHAFIQYGLNSFTFEILEETTMLKEREQYWIDYLEPTYNSMRSKGNDVERQNESRKKYNREWNKAHYDKHLAKTKEWQKDHYIEMRDYNKKYYSRLCLYEGESLTLRALYQRFVRQRIPNAFLEAKKYLLEK